MTDHIFKKDERILLMTEAYPFFLIGTIQSFDHESVCVKAEFGVPLPLKDREFNFHKDAISAFCVENEHCKIPTAW